jgi:hypothetical protein
MTGPGGKWFTLKEYTEASGISEDEAKEYVRSLGLTTRVSDGRDYVWVEDFGKLEGAGDRYERDPEDSGSDGERGDKDDETSLKKSPGKQDGAPVEGEALVSKFSGAQELAHQAERAISLVERSMGTFMTMHQEVVKEKDRFIELSREGVEDQERKIAEMNDRIEELEQQLREREQELADLKMLVEILEGRSARPGQAPVYPKEEEAREGARSYGGATQVFDGRPDGERAS